MLQLRSFVHQRLFAAAEEILGEVEKTITLALHEAHSQQPKQNHHSQKPGPDRLQQRSEPQPTPSPPKELQEISTRPSTQEVKSNLNQVPDQSETTASFVQIGLGLKVEQEEPREDNEIQVVIFPSDEVVKSEQDQAETDISDEMQPLSSDCSDAETDSKEIDEEWARNRRTKIKIKRQKSGGNSSARKRNGPLVCPTCGKGFQYIRPLMKHIATHKKPNGSMNEFLHYLQSAYNKAFICDYCGKKFARAGCLKAHSKIHTGVRDFSCQDCGKTFVQKGHLTVHKRTHSGERPYYCRFCGKGFSQKQHLLAHNRRKHMGENDLGSDMIQVDSSVS